ncbi:hypothetical protein HK104_005287 [Borealophlyctis nickersoniae]|nr:hypothetical protein HK104_005287 [Borealophlyctis nickersoniae]
MSPSFDLDQRTQKEWLEDQWFVGRKEAEVEEPKVGGGVQRAMESSEADGAAGEELQDMSSAGSGQAKVGSRLRSVEESTGGDGVAGRKSQDTRSGPSGARQHQSRGSEVSVDLPDNRTYRPVPVPEQPSPRVILSSSRARAASRMAINLGTSSNWLTPWITPEEVEKAFEAAKTEKEIKIRPWTHELDLPPPSPPKAEQVAQKTYWEDIERKLSNPNVTIETKVFTDGIRDRRNVLQYLSLDAVWLIFETLKSRGATRQLILADWHRLIHRFIYHPLCSPTPPETPHRSFEILKEMKRCGVAPDAFMYSSIIRACKDDIKKVDHIRKFVLKLAEEAQNDAQKDASSPSAPSSSSSSSSLLPSLSFLSSSTRARVAHTTTPLISDKFFLTLLGVYLRPVNGFKYVEKAASLREDMRKFGMQPNVDASMAFLEAFGALGDAGGVASIHAGLIHRRISGLKWGTREYEALMVAHDGCGNFKAVERLWTTVLEKKVPFGFPACKSYLHALAHFNDNAKIANLHRYMDKEKIPYDDDCMAVFAHAYAQLGNVSELTQRVRKRLERRLTSHERKREKMEWKVLEKVLEAYALAGDVEGVEQTFEVLRRARQLNYEVKFEAEQKAAKEKEEKAAKLAEEKAAKEVEEGAVTTEVVVEGKGEVVTGADADTAKPDAETSDTSATTATATTIPDQTTTETPPTSTTATPTSPPKPRGKKYIPPPLALPMRAHLCMVANTIGRNSKTLDEARTFFLTTVFSPSLLTHHHTLALETYLKDLREERDKALKSLKSAKYWAAQPRSRRPKGQPAVSSVQQKVDATQRALKKGGVVRVGDKGPLGMVYDAFTSGWRQRVELEGDKLKGPEEMILMDGFVSEMVGVEAQRAWDAVERKRRRVRVRVDGFSFTDEWKSRKRVVESEVESEVESGSDVEGDWTDWESDEGEGESVGTDVDESDSESDSESDEEEGADEGDGVVAEAREDVDEMDVEADGNRLSSEGLASDPADFQMDEGRDASHERNPDGGASEAKKADMDDGTTKKEDGETSIRGTSATQQPQPQSQQ